MTAHVLAIAEEPEDEPRLYSKGFQDRVPVDEVAPGQLTAHAWFIRWGRWQGTRPSSPGLASIEGLYVKAGTPPSTAPMASDPTLMAIEVVVLDMPIPHRDTMCMLYVRRLTPYTICRSLKPGLRYESWPNWIFSCRAMAQRMAYEIGYSL